MRPKGVNALRGRSFSKAIRVWQAMRRRFSKASSTACGMRKAAGFQRLPPGSNPRKIPGGSEPALAVPVRAAVAVETVMEAFHEAVVPRAVLAAAKRAVMPGQHGEASLLALVEGLVEGIGGIGDLLQGGGGRAHVLGALAQAGDRILSPVGVLAGVARAG